jgi:HSP20 family protein
MVRHPLAQFRSSPMAERGYFSDPFMMLHREMNRLFDDIMHTPATAAGQTAQGNGMPIVPRIDISETDKEIRIAAELPGVAEKDIDVSLDDDVLTIRGEKKSEHRDDKENYHVVERTFGSFQRSLRLPYPVDPDQIKASFDQGVLNVVLPKGKEVERRHHIPISHMDVASNGAQSNGSQADKMPDHSTVAGTVTSSQRNMAQQDPKHA